MKYNKFIDHTLLKADATIDQIKKLCEEAKEYDFASVCVNSCYVKDAYEFLKDSNVKVCTVVGFPLGAMSSKSKNDETVNALNDGASEIDMVINVGKLKNKEYDYVLNEIALLANSVHQEHKLLKVIIETCLLTDEEKIKACQLAKTAKADFVKTSTGFSSGGATIHDVELMRKTVGNEMGVKASGGIRDYQTMLDMINAGANRIGTSSGVKLCNN